MKILLLGKNGQVGWELRRVLPLLGQVVALGSDDLDLQKGPDIRQSIRSMKPDVIVNAAAYTQVDRAEEEPEKARVVNAAAPGVMAEEAERLGAYFIHYSTDYVFDGKKGIPYNEEDSPNPINVYGQTKLEGEQAIARSGAFYLILRTSWIYGLRGKNFLLTMLRLAAEKDELRIVEDQHGCPTWCRMLAEATGHILARGRTGWPWGIYHAAAKGQTSWFGFAQAILAHQDLGGRPNPPVIPISSREFAPQALRPENSVLSSEKLTGKLGISMPNWEDGLNLALQELQCR